MKPNKKRTKLTLSEVETQMEVLTKEEMNILKGGGDGTYGSPYTLEEFNLLLDYGLFIGGHVVGMGYVNALEPVTVVGPNRKNPGWGSEFSYYNPWENQHSEGNNNGQVYGPRQYVGGGGGSDGSGHSQNSQQPFPSNYKPSCVFNVFDYLDGNRHNAYHYYSETKRNLGYEPSPNGAVKTSDIAKIGSFGGFKVVEISADHPMNRKTGNTFPGNNPVVMTFLEAKTGIDHAVVVTGIRENQGNIFVQYYDPTTNQTGERQNRDYSGLYEVIQK